MYHHSTLQGILQGNLSSGIEKIAKNNYLSKVKNDYRGLAGLHLVSNRPNRHNRPNRLNRTKKSPASVPCWQGVLNLVRPGGVPVGPLGASYKTTRHTVPRKGPHSSNVGSRTCCQSPTPQGLCFPYHTIFANFFPYYLQCGRAVALCPPQLPLIESMLDLQKSCQAPTPQGHQRLSDNTDEIF